MWSNRINKKSFFVFLLISVILISVWPQPATSAPTSKAPYPGNKWNIKVESTWMYTMSEPNGEMRANWKWELEGNFYDLYVGNLTGALRAQRIFSHVELSCTPVDRNYQIQALLNVGFGSTTSKRKLQFFDKNPPPQDIHQIVCTSPGGVTLTFSYPYSPTVFNTGLDAEIPLVEGTHTIKQSWGSIIQINKYTFKPTCDEIVHVPMMVNLINSPKKPDGSLFIEQDVKDFIRGMNGIYEQSCVEFELVETKNIEIEDYNPNTLPGGIDNIRDHAKTEFRNRFPDGKGVKISLTDDLGVGAIANGVAIPGDQSSLVVDTRYGDVGTWAHEEYHGYNYGDQYSDPTLLSYGVRRTRTDTKLTPDEKNEIHEKAKKIGRVEKKDPVKVNLIRDLKIDNISDVFFYTNSTPATGYNFTDIDELFIFSEEPYTSYDFKLSFKDMLALNQKENIIVRIFIDTNGNPLTGVNGYDRIALLNLTGIFPFKGTYGLKILNTSSNAELFNGTTNVSAVINREEIDFENPPNNTSYIHRTFGYNLYFDISDAALNSLNLSSKKSNVLVQVDSPAVQVRDEMNFRFSNSPEVSPLLTAEPYNVMPNGNITLNGSGFSPNTNVNISINYTQLASVITDPNGNFSIQLKVPELAEHWYTITAIDTNIQYDFTIINVVMPTLTLWAPSITDFAPVSLVNDTAINDTAGATRTFNITVDQIANVTWYINGKEVFNQTDVNESSYTNASAAVDTWNVNATATNANGTTSLEWTWIVTAAPAGAPSIISFTPSSPVKDTIGATRVFNITMNQAADVTWYINGTPVQTNMGVTQTSYTNTSAAQGIWNVSAVAANTNGSAMQKWDWIVTAPPVGAPAIISWGNNKTNYASLSVLINVSETIRFNATANQSIDTWNWFLNNINQNNNFDNFSNHFATPGTYLIKVNASNANGTSSTVTWNVNVAGLPPIGAPNITSFSPHTTTVMNNAGESRTFSIAVNQTVNVSWLINGIEVFNETGVTTSSYINSSAAAGIWNVTAVVSNVNGSDSQTWTWIVQSIVGGEPNITSFAPPSLVNDTAPATRTFNITVNQTVNVTWYFNEMVHKQDNLTIESNNTITADAGTHNVTAVVQNANGSDSRTWNWNVTATIPSVRFITDKSAYIQGEPVKFTIINNGTTTIDLPSSAPWWVENATGERIFSPIALDVITLLEPGQSISWTWDQKDSEGQQVPPEMYQGVIKTSIGNISTQEFEILTAPTPTAGTISGYKINDTNGNGRWDAGEKGIPNWTTIRLIGITDRGMDIRVIRKQTFTNAQGLYKFDDLPAGRYILIETIQRGWIPTSSIVRNIKLAKGENSVNNNFTNRLLRIRPTPTHIPTSKLEAPIISSFSPPSPVNNVVGVDFGSISGYKINHVNDNERLEGSMQEGVTA